MNKFTKLLSVFVIAGAVSAGVAGLTGCGSTPETHTHNGTKHEAVAATCTQTGTKEYYTCDGSDCEGKYFEDAACTTEVTLESLTIAALGHTATKVDAKDPTCTVDGNKEYYTCSGSECEGKKYTDATCTTEKTDVVIEATGHTEKYEDKGDGTHGITCEKGDLTETTAPHADEDGDNKCDKCEAFFFAAGKYYNASNASEFEILANSKIIYNGKEYALSAVTENETTKALSATFTITIGDQSQEYTLTKTATGYTISYQYGSYGTVTKDYLPMPEIIATDFDEFAGVYEGELTYSDGGVTYKLTKFSISEYRELLFTSLKADESTLVTFKNAENSSVSYNEFSVEGWTFVAKTADENGVLTVEVTYGDVTATFTKTAEEVPTIPSELPVDELTYYNYTAATEEEESYTFVVNSSTNYNRYTLNNKRIELISGDDTDGYLIKTSDSDYNPINYLLKISADKSAIELYAADKTTKLATLALTEQSFPEIKVDGTANDFAVTDLFNEDYAYYKVGATGWYTITAGSSDVKLFTEVVGHLPTGSGETVLTIGAGKSKTVYLEANALVAVESWKVSNSFTAEYSETEPVEEAATFTNGKYEIAEFDGTQTYTIKGKTTSATKYYVTVACSERTEAQKTCLIFSVNGGVEYGSYYDASSWKFVTKDAGLIYSADLAADTDVTVVVSTPNTGWDFGKVIVYFETEEEYNARLNGGSEEETDLFSADQIGTYVYADGNDLTFKVEANQITMSGGQYGYGTYNPTITKSGDTYTLSYMGYKLVFSFNADGNIAVTSDNIYDYNSFIAVKQTSSEEEPTTPVAVVGNNTISAGQTGNGSLILNEAGTWTVTYVSGVSYILLNNGLVLDGGTVTVTAGNPLTIVVYVDVANATEAVINLAFEASSEEPADNTLSVGDNTINIPSNEVNYTFTATEAGEYTVTYDSTGWVNIISDNGSELLSSGSKVTLSAGETLTLECSMYDYPSAGTYTLTIAKASSGSGDEPTTPVAVVGENTVQAGKGGSVDIEFSVAGTYTITYDGDADNVYYIEVDGVTVANGGKFTVTDPVTITVYASDTSAESKFTIAVAEEGGEATVNKVENGGNLALGANEVTTYDGYKATVYLTASETLPAGTYTLTISNIWSGSLYVGDTWTMDDGNGNATVEVTLGDTPIAIQLEQPNSGNANIVVAAKTTTEDSGSSEVGGADEGIGDGGSEI